MVTLKCVCVSNSAASNRRKLSPVISDPQEVLPIVWSRLRDVGQDELETERCTLVGSFTLPCVCGEWKQRKAFELHASRPNSSLGVVLYAQASVAPFDSARTRWEDRRRSRDNLEVVILRRLSVNAGAKFWVCRRIREKMKKDPLLAAFSISR